MQNVMAEQQQDAWQDNANFLDTRATYVPRGVVTAHQLVIERAKGSEVWDVEGNRYLDFVGGIGVLNVGHNHPEVVSAVAQQLGKVFLYPCQTLALKAPDRFGCRPLCSLTSFGYN